MRYRARFTTENLPEYARDIVGQLEEIEACSQRGVLRDLRKRETYSGYIDSAFWQILAWPDITAIGRDCPKRQEWLDTCLRRFQGRLQAPTHRFEATRSTIPREVECRAPEGLVHLRFDQIAYQRSWGIEIFGCDHTTDNAIARACIRAAFAQLRDDWESVNRFCALASTQPGKFSHLQFTEDLPGNRFEQLLLGIVNEKTPEAESASLYQDACEWTDLRVLRPEHDRYLRLQAKFYASVAQNDGELGERIAAGNCIVITPVEIARYIENHMSTQSDFSWLDLLALSGRKVGSLEELSRSIYCHLFDLLAGPLPEHPFGYIAEVPWLLRRAIRSLVESKARAIEGTPREAVPVS